MCIVSRCIISCVNVIIMIIRLNFSYLSLVHVPRNAALAHLRSETGRWLLTEDHIVQDILCCAMYAGNVEVFNQKLKVGAGFYEPSSGILYACSIMSRRYPAPRCRFV